jgi:hypothetical protein
MQRMRTVFGVRQVNAQMAGFLGGYWTLSVRDGIQCQVGCI